MKEEFEREFEGISYNTDDIWAWVEKKLLESYQRGFENGIKWQKLENKEEE